MDVASDAEDMMKRKLHRKFSYFDDVAFGEAYAHFCAASIQNPDAPLDHPLLSNNSSSHGSSNASRSSSGNSGSNIPSGRQHDTQDNV